MLRINATRFVHDDTVYKLTLVQYGIVNTTAEASAWILALHNHDTYGITTSFKLISVGLHCNYINNIDYIKIIG